MPLMRLSLVPAITIASLAWLAAAPAAAHVAPAIGDNNRYIKLTPMGDRVRLAYTVFYGELPGAALRRTIDANRDGAIDDAESQAFGDRVAREIAAALEVTVDGAPRPVAWAQVVVGMGSARTAAGSFSIDMVAWLCVAPPRGSHAVLLRDRFQIDRPGETEVKVEDSPGVRLDRTRIGDDDDLGIEYKIIGAGGPLHDSGLDLRFTAGDTAIVTADAVCRRAPPPRELPAGVIVGGVAATALALAGVVAIARRQWRARRSGAPAQARRTRR
jgi:hypothetical protein